MEQTNELPAGYVVAPDFRGYAHLGVGAYVLNHSGPGELPELVVSVATEEEKAGRVIGDHRDNPPGHVLQPDAMAVRLRFENVAGLDALESQLLMLREEHFPGTSHQAIDKAQTEAYAEGRKDEADENGAASRLIDAWAASHGKPVPWDKAVEIVAIVNKLPEEERARLLALA